LRDGTVRIGHVILLSLGAGVATGALRAQDYFKPGNVFVSDLSFKYCHAGTGAPYPDLIWEIDPETGEVTLFASLGGQDCGVVTGLAFTPDGCRLRAAQSLHSRILEFAPNGMWTVALDRDDGIRGPYGANCLAYDAKGDFYVANTGRTEILRYPADGSPGTAFTNAVDPFPDGGSLAFSANGDLYFGSTNTDAIFRITPDGLAWRFADLSPGLLESLAADIHGHVYAGLISSDPFRFGLYRYHQGDPTSEERFATHELNQGTHAITTAPTQTEVYLAGSVFGRPIPRQVLAIDVRDGTIRVVATASGNAFGSGIAVVPVEPGDVNRNRFLGIEDWLPMMSCLGGPNAMGESQVCGYADLDHDRDVDIVDVARFLNVFGNTAYECP
jgi:DNA-binding beta-propeller fold protein YncE